MPDKSLRPPCNFCKNWKILFFRHFNYKQSTLMLPLMHQHITNSSKIKKLQKFLLTISIWYVFLCSWSQPVAVVACCVSGFDNTGPLFQWRKLLLSHPQVVWQMRLLFCDFIFKNFPQIFYRVLIGAVFRLLQNFHFLVFQKIRYNSWPVSGGTIMQKDPTLMNAHMNF